MIEKKQINIDIGHRIQQSREKTGLTQEQLAEQINRTTQFISSIERGISGISIETILNICTILGVSTEWILRGLESTPSTDYIAAKLSVLSDEQLNTVNSIIDDILSLIN